MILQKRPLVNRPIINKPVSKGLEIQQSSGVPSIYKTSWLIMGLPGIGKTTLSAGFGQCLVLCTSEKELTSVKVPYLLIDTWEKVLEVTDELLNNRQKYEQYKFIIVDFVDAVHTLCIAAVCEKLGITHASEAGYGKGTDTIDVIFRRWVTQLIASDYGIVFVSHVVQKDVITQGNSITKIVCSLAPRARNILFPLVNVVGCIEYRTVKQESGIQGKTALVRKRVISFTGSEYTEAKERDGVLPDEIILLKDGQANFQVFCDFYEGRRTRKGG